MRMVAMARNHGIDLTVTDIFKHHMAGIKTLFQLLTISTTSDYEPFSLLPITNSDELFTLSIQPPLWSRE